MRTIPIVGRNAELDRIRRFVGGLGLQGGALLLTGDPGIGKSALAGAACEFAREVDSQILRASGSQSEAQMPFATLHQLLRPVMDEIEALPERQRGVLLGALGRAGGQSPDQYLVALATLDLLAELAEKKSLLVVVDDAHWVDPSTASVLAFVARRLDVDPIGLILVLRSEAESPLLDLELDEIEVGPLDADAAAQVLDLRDSRLSLRARTRVLRESAGNPLALVELPTSGSEAESMVLSSRLNRAFGARLQGLPDPTRAVLLTAALNDGDHTTEALEAAALFSTSVGAEALDIAIDRQIVTLDSGRLVFRHPLMRSAVVQAATVPDRRRAHASLASALSDQPHRSIWHRASSIVELDETVAEELQSVASRADNTGNAVVSLASWERAAQLSASPHTRLRRLLRAAELAVELGQSSKAVALADLAEALVSAPVDRARLVLIRHAVEAGSVGDVNRSASLVEAARSASKANDPELALQLLYAAALQGWWGDANEATRFDVIAATRELGLDHTPMALAVLGQADPTVWAEPVVTAVASLKLEELNAASASLIGTAFVVGGADRNMALLQSALADGLRLQGRIRDLPALLAQQVWTSINLADWSTALPAADEGMRLARETGQPNWLAATQIGAGMLAALRGDHEQARDLVAQGEEFALPRRISALLSGVQLTRGVSAIARGEFDEAFAALRREFSTGDAAFHEFQNRWAFGDLAEAGFHAGRVTEVREIAARQGRVVVTPWHAVAAEYAAPFLVEDDAAAGSLFETMLAGEVSRWPVYRVRALIEYGAWLRRHRRTVDARDILREARDSADALGLAPWAERARQELRAAGELSGSRRPAAWESLSPQELQVAQLAAAGMSNREIGQRLFLSHRTVGSHLYRLFPKLGITNRAQLAATITLGMA